MTTAPDTDATPPVETTSRPSRGGAAIRASARLNSSRQVPRKPVEQPVAEAAAEPPARPPAPQISPQLSPVDQASYQRKTNEDVSVAKKNLQAAKAGN